MKKIKNREQLDNQIKDLKSFFGDAMSVSSIKDFMKFFKGHFNKDIIQVGDKLVFDLSTVFNMASKIRTNFDNDPIQPITVTYRRLDIIFFTYDKHPEKGEQYIMWDSDWMQWLHPTQIKQSVLFEKKAYLKEKDPNEYYLQVNAFNIDNKYTTLIKDIDFSDYE